jgi:thiamine pyrophosphate-dependent acetolactate synthase large subunit-like protein
MPSAGEIAVQQLVAGGVRYFAGMVGSVTVPLVAAIARQPGARFLAVRHEHVAASLLDGAARLSGVPGVCLLHSASGSLAASLGIASAQRWCHGAKGQLRCRQTMPIAQITGASWPPSP